MEKARRLTELWNWLPAFRVVAETEHLPSAAKLLEVSPSALSRAVSLLEQSVGRPLFSKEGRRIRLNPDGREFLEAVREGMRRVHEGLLCVTDSQLAVTLRVTSMGVFNKFVCAAAVDMQREHPDLVLHLENVPSSEVNGLLLRGQMDAAFLPDPTPHDSLHIEHVADMTNGIYCGRGHPLFRIARPSRKAVLAHAFAAPPAESEGMPPDNWPISVERRITLRIQHLQSAIDLCARGHILAVLPDHDARTYPKSGTLRRLPVPIAPPTRFYVVRRRRLEQKDAADMVIDAVRRHARKAQQEDGP